LPNLHLLQGKAIVILQLGKKLSPFFGFNRTYIQIILENEFYEYDEYFFYLANRQRYLKKLILANCTFSISLPEY
jgi:hypothetical protein